MDLGKLLAQLHLLSPSIPPLTHVCTYVYNTVEHGWENRGSFRSASAVGPLLLKIYMLNRSHQLHTYLQHVSSYDNSMVNSASCLTHLSERLLLAHFRLNFPQTTPWRLLRLPSTFRHQLTNMLIKKCLPKACPLQYKRDIPAPGSNADGYADGCTSPQISTASKTQSPSSIFFMSAYAPAFYPRGATPYGSAR